MSVTAISEICAPTDHYDYHIPGSLLEVCVQPGAKGDGHVESSHEHTATTKTCTHVAMQQDCVVRNRRHHVRAGV